MKKKIVLFLTVSFLILVGSLRADVTFGDLFHIAPTAAESSLGIKRVKMLQAAVDDFNAVLNFKSPTHAKSDADAPVPADGGTIYYKGAGYRLTIMKSLFTMGDSSKTPV